MRIKPLIIFPEIFKDSIFNGDLEINVDHGTTETGLDVDDNSIDESKPGYEFKYRVFFL